MEGTYSYDQGYTPWNPPPYQHHDPQYNAYQSNGFGYAYYGYEDPPSPYPPYQTSFEEAFQLLYQERKEHRENQRRISAQLTTLHLSVLCFVIQSTNSNFINSSIASQPLNSGETPSQEPSILRGSIPTLFLCTNQEGREDAPLNEEDVENLNHEEVHECLEEVEEENEDQEAEDVDHEEEDKDKEQKGMVIVHSASSEATPSKLPSELRFEWVNFSNLNFIGPQHYGLLETDGQLKALYGVMDKREMDSLGLDESRFTTCGKPKICSRHLLKLYNNRGKVRAFSLRKHLKLCQFQEKLVDSQNNGWTNQVWDSGKGHKSQHFWGFITCLGVLANLIYMAWNPIKNTKSKHWWRFIASIKALRSLVHATWDTRDQCNNKNWWRFQEEFKHKPP
ncbi:hypothetical protein PIB30_058648 [Stylosanthes scabra]|uniref:Uncharacterized protein n=1 Tax=Stylosanthes scabra TaxID=79078 RepID=A0ABU6VI88_9FABA|nr:hypothetical protein [Stylosanthes scabra]